MANPSSDNHFDVQQPIRVIKVIQTLIRKIPGFITKEQLKAILKLIHIPSLSLKEEVGELLLELTNEFTDENKLMEIQRYNPSKDNEEEMKINFFEEPNKSQRQIQTLIEDLVSNIETKKSIQKDIEQYEGGKEKFVAHAL